MTHATGVLNGNFRNGAYFHYAQDAEREAKKAAVIATCQDIRDMMTQEQYDAWWEAAPDENFLEYAKAELARLQAEPGAVEAAAALEPSREPEEISADVAQYAMGEDTFLAQLEAQHRDWLDEKRTQEEARM